MPFPITVNRVSTQQKALAPEISTWPDENPQLIGSRCGACGATTFPVQQRCPKCSRAGRYRMQHLVEERGLGHNVETQSKNDQDQ